MVAAEKMQAIYWMQARHLKMGLAFPECISSGLWTIPWIWVGRSHWVLQGKRCTYGISKRLIAPATEKKEKESFIENPDILNYYRSLQYTALP